MMGKRNRWILLALPTIVTGLILIVILNWHIPTRVRITLKTSRVVFRLGGEEKSSILDSVGLKSIIIEKFESIKFKPESLTILSAGKESGSRQNGPNKTLTIQQRPVVISSRNARNESNVIFRVAEGSGLVLINTVSAKPTSEVTLETTDDPGDLIVRIENQQSSGNLTVGVPVVLALDQCDVKGVRMNFDPDKPLTMKAKLSSDSSIEFNGLRNALVLTLTVSAEKEPNLFPEGFMPVTAIKFEALDGQNGKVISSLVRDTSCDVSYPDYQNKIDKVSIRSPAFLSLDELQSFSIEELTYDRDQKGISLTLQGIAGKIASGSADYQKDHTLAVYDVIWSNHKVIALFVALCWVVGSTIFFFKLVKEQRE